MILTFHVHPIDFLDDVCYNGKMSTKPLTTIGSNALITVAGIKNVPAKVDTGADSSSIWASNITMSPDNKLEFCLFGPESSLYTGKKIILNNYKVQRVRSSTGQVTVRYRVSLPIVAVGKRIKASFTLYDRSSNNFPVLIGRKTLKNRFLVDVSKTDVKRPAKMDNSDLETELAADPQKFHTKLYQLHNKCGKIQS